MSAAAGGVDDRQLVRRFQSGDQAAFEGLVRRYEGPLYGLAFRYLKRRALAEEAVQDVFLKAFKALPRYQEQGYFKAWLYRIATNHFINRSRKAARRRMHTLDGMQGEDGAPLGQALADPAATEPWQDMAREERIQAVQAALDRLPERYRGALFLHKYQELSYDEIGAVLELKIPAVKSLLYRARMKLKEELEGGGEFPRNHPSP